MSSPNTNEVLSKSRIEAFSDGVFAIAITLLVLDIHIPDGLKGHALNAALFGLWSSLSAYALSFVITGVYWVAHHIMLHSVQRPDRTLLWLNNLVLMFIAFIPASAAMLGNYPHEQRIVIWYGCNLILASGALELFWLYITRSPSIATVDPVLARRGQSRTLSALGIYVIAVTLAFVDTRLSIAMYWLGPILYIFLQSHVDDRSTG